MYKKLISSILVVALLKLIGCYSLESVTVAEYQQIKEEDKPKDIIAITADYKEYHFADSGYYVKNDTLYGKGFLFNKEGEQVFDGKIALIDIESFQVNKLDGGTTAGLVIGSLIVVGVIIYAIVLSDALSNR